MRHALADPTRLTIVRTRRQDPERACGTFPVDVAPSTLTHHFRILREADVISQREEGSRRWGTRFLPITQAWLNAWEYVIPFVAFSPEVRRVICTTDERFKSVGWVARDRHLGLGLGVGVVDPRAKRRFWD